MPNNHILEKLIVSQNDEEIEYLNGCNGLTLVAESGFGKKMNENGSARQLYIKDLPIGSFVSIRYGTHTTVFYKDNDDFQLILNHYNEPLLTNIFYGRYTNNELNTNQIILNYNIPDNNNTNKIYISILCPMGENISSLPVLYKRPEDESNNLENWDEIRSFSLDSYRSKHLLVSAGETLPPNNSAFNFFIQTGAMS